MNNSIAAGVVLPLEPVTSIYIAIEGGLRLVEAMIVGSFGLHLSQLSLTVDSTSSRWILTHVGSGRALAKVCSERDALALAERLNALPVDWDFRTPEQMSGWPEAHINQVTALVERFGQPFHPQSPAGA